MRRSMIPARSAKASASSMEWVWRGGGVSASSWFMSPFDRLHSPLGRLTFRGLQLLLPAKWPASPQHRGLMTVRPIAIRPGFLFYWISFPLNAVRNLSYRSHPSTQSQDSASSYSHQIIAHPADLQMEPAPSAGGYDPRWRLYCELL